MTNQNNWHNFTDWHDIRDWCEKHNFNNLVARMEANNAYWDSCGEFGRSQVMICDSIRFADTEDEALDIAAEMDDELAGDFVTSAFKEKSGEKEVDDSLAYI